MFSLLGNGRRVFGPRWRDGHRHGGLQNLPEDLRQAGTQVQAPDQSYFSCQVKVVAFFQFLMFYERCSLVQALNQS